jgi:hypothetical protein
VSDCLIKIELEDGGRFDVQRAMLCTASEYFRKAVGGSFAEADTKTLRLPGCTTASFELILYWLCHSSLPETLYEVKQVATTERVGVAHAAQAKLVDLWIQCDMLLLPGLQNEAAGKLQELTLECELGAEATRTAFVNTSMQSPLRRLLIASFIHEQLPYPQGEKLEDDHGALTELGSIPGFLAALLKTLCSCRNALCQGRACADNDHTEPDIDEFMVPEYEL